MNMRANFALSLFVGLALAACQPAKPEPTPRQTAVFDYSLLGIWPERYQAYEVSNALGEAGIRTTLSGVRPCILNVETAKLSQAYSILRSNPVWMEGARISGQAAPAHDVISVTPATSSQR